MTNITKKLIVLCLGLFLTSSLYAMKQDNILNEMSGKIDTVLTILQDSSLEKNEKPSKIFAVMDEVFDYKVMARISLGKSWKSLTTEQKNQFTQRFEIKLKNSYVDKLDLYTNEKVEVLESKQVKSNRIVLLTNVIGKDDVYKINYKFYKTKQGEWFIYDVDIIGVSIIQTYRKQFAGFLKENSFDDLLKTL